MVMHKRIACLDWRPELYDVAPPGHRPPKHRHNRLKNRFLSFIENTFFAGRHLFASQHFVLLKGDDPELPFSCKYVKILE